MCSSDCGDGLRSWAWSQDNKEHQTDSTKPPLQITQVGDERSLAGRVQRSQVRNVQPPSYEPGHPITHLTGNPNHRLVITEYNQSRSNCVLCLSQWSTIPQSAPEEMYGFASVILTTQKQCDPDYSCPCN